MAQRIEVRVPFQGFYHSIHEDAIDRAEELRNEDVEEDEQEVVSLTAESIRAYVSYYLVRLSGRLPCDDNFTDFRVSSPREYNFHTDQIIATLHADTLRVLLAEVNSMDAQGFRQRVSEALEPRSGFVPFYSNDLSDWPEDPAEWGTARLELLIRFYMESEHGEEWEENILDEMQGNGECDLQNYP